MDAPLVLWVLCLVVGWALTIGWIFASALDVEI
jgi:hypothetical protein